MIKNEMIQRVMSENPKFLTLRDSLYQALSVFAKEKFHHLPVLNGQQVVGMFTFGDLSRYLKSQGAQQLETELVSQHMSQELHTVSIYESLRQAAEKLCSGRFHALPVVDHRNHLCGMITSTDLIHHLLIHIPKGDGTLIPAKVDALQARVKVLEEVRMAAELFLRTGHGELEHRVLLEKLAQADNPDVTL